MNRRKAIYAMIATAGVTGSIASYKWFQWNKTPNISIINSKVELLNELAEVIIPETETPGAKSANVGSVISMLIEECTERRSQNRFISGLLDLEEYCMNNFNANFPELQEKQKVMVLEYFEEKDRRPSGLIGKAMNKFIGKTFFQTLKEKTAYAFCTSSVGATQALAYNPIPAKFIGCTEKEKKQKSWATH